MPNHHTYKPGDSLDIAYEHLENYEPRNKRAAPICIWDFDHTLTIAGNESKEFYPGRQEMIDLANHAANMGYRNIILTARPLESKQATIENLKQLGVFYHRVICNDNDDHPSFKRRVRQLLESSGHEIVLCVGDKMFDVKGCEDHTLPIKIDD
jgi:phosphoglycolate phosphatase-like HAD superfamily hydrolase